MNIFKTSPALLLVMLIAPLGVSAAPVNIVNHSFEVDPNTFNEFRFGPLTGWTVIDDNNILDNNLDLTGTLEVTGGNYFGGVAPDGDNVALIFIGTDAGGGEVGLSQILTETLAANTHYSLSVEVGNINSGNATNGSFFDLSGFPGFRIELWAGNTLLERS